MTPPKLAVAFLAAVAVACPPPAHAASGPCDPGDREGPRCTIWKGTVDWVADGDTLDVDVRGDATRRPVRVRVTGINATEHTVYSRRPARRRGECHALAATARLERLVRRSGGRVRLAAQDPRSRSRHRLRRAVAVKLRGRWRDAGAILVREGHALWLPNRTEWAFNARYRALAARAADRGLRLWDPAACGGGHPADVAVEVNWDAPGRDDRNAAGEWVRVINRDPVRPLSLAGWRVRDSHLRGFRFPATAIVAPGGSVRLRVGRGSGLPGEFSWGLDKPIFENATHDARALGDGAYLFDPAGALRAHEQYPEP